MSYAQSIDPDQPPRYSESDLGLFANVPFIGYLACCPAAT